MWWLVATDRTRQLDRDSFNLLAGTRGGWLAVAGKPLATVGTVVPAIALLALIHRLWRDRLWPELSALAGGFALCGAVARAVKLIERRPRPPSTLIHAGGFAFPSTDSALAVGVAVMALLAARHYVAPRYRRRLILAGYGLTFGAGVLFVALRVHYASDVVAGWALGSALFSACFLLAGEYAARR